MRTEDETAMVLRRIPIKEMERHYRELDDIAWNRMSDAEVENFFAQYGWTEYAYRGHRYED